VFRSCVIVFVGVMFAGANEPPKTEEKKTDVKEPVFVTEFKVTKEESRAKLLAVHVELEKAWQASKTQAERDAIFARGREETDKIYRPAAEKIMTAVRPYAASPDAVEVLVWVANVSRGPQPGSEAVRLLQTHHLTHPQTITLAERFNFSPTKWVEPLLREQLASPDLPKASRSRVLYDLAVTKQYQSKLPGELLAMSDDQIAQMNDLYGKDVIEGVRRMDVTKAETEAIGLFTELAQKYWQEKTDRGLAFGDVAKSAIFEIQHLSIGKVAPDIVGEDTEGVKFKLSEYRGKVVMLSFWGTWCGPCMGLVPHERELVERLKGKPFALIGVNSDKNKTKLAEVMKDEKITWRSFWCGEKGSQGEIPSAWNVAGWPTIYVLDHNGVIRAKQAIGKPLDRIIDALIQEVEAKR